MDGTYGFRCDECRELGDMLKRKTGIDVEYQDERLTTVIAHGYLNDNNVRGKKEKKRLMPYLLLLSFNLIWIRINE